MTGAPAHATSGGRYGQVLSQACVASAGAYNLLPTPDTQTFDDPLTDAQATLTRGQDKDGSPIAIVAFRGSTSASDWIGNALVPMLRVPGHGRRVRAHAGFVRQYVSLDSAIQSALASMCGSISSVLFCGHSLGGALACIACSMWTSCVPCQLVTFGAPRPGNAAFGSVVRSKTSGLITRVVHDLDLVPTTPMRAMSYQHVEPSWLMVDHGGTVVCESLERTVCEELFLRVWGVLAADFGVSDHFMIRYSKAMPAQAAPAPEPDSNAEAEADAEPDAEAEAEADADAEPEPEAKPEAKPEAEAEPAAEAEAEAEPKPAAEADTEPDAKPEPEAEPDAKPEPDAEPAGEAEPTTDAEPEPEKEQTTTDESGTRAPVRRAVSRRVKK